MKKLLIVSYLFAPASVIGAIRWSKMAKYLAPLGYDIDILTTSAKVPEDKLLARDFENASNISIIRIDHKNSKYDQTLYYRDSQTAAVLKKAAETGTVPLSRRVKNAIWSCKALMPITSLYVASQDYGRSKDFFVQAKAYISRNLTMSDYDAVICTYGPTCGTLIGNWIKKEYPDTPVIMDFRDPMTNSSNPAVYRNFYGKLQRRVCNRADRILSVTEDISARVCPKQLSSKSSVIPNGYDPEDFSGIEPTTDNRYSIVYTGAIYKDFADFSPLFTALRELSDEGEISLDNIVINYIGRSGAVIEEQAAAHGLSSIIKNHGVLPRTQTLSWQLGARQLLLTIWNNKNDGGYRPGKLLEYMAAGRPVIGLVSGDAGDSVLRRTIEQGRFGIAYENASANADYKALRDYIAADYKRWQQGLDSELAPDSDYIGSFSYPALASQVAELIESI